MYPFFYIIFLVVVGCSESKFVPISDEGTDSSEIVSDVDDGPVDGGADTAVQTDADADGGIGDADDTGEAPCPDSDGDTVCNEDDVCEGQDDTIDADGDGVPDGCDPCPSDSPDDTDGDGVCNSDDICEGAEDSFDMDGDGVPDGCDWCPFDPADDSDGDGVCDSMDDCEGHDDSVDADDDGAPDPCDPCPLDALDDSDDDGICDSDDVCPGHDDLVDGDGDMVADGCDVCPFDAPDDSDGDGVCDSDDECPGHDDLVDGDGDAVADGCDVCPLDVLDDSDGDGVCDSDDECSGHDDLVDGDGDTVADGCDVCPFDAPDDTDGDGVCDTDDTCPGEDDGEDLDEDGVPDACDDCPLDNPDDIDGDEVCDSDDVCPGGDDGLDTDDDGVADHCDACPLDNPDDGDGDGLCDSDPIPLPQGLIVAFTGSEVPEGWIVCDGEAGTPDLRERFVLGVTDEDPGVTGGSDAHDHEGFTDVTEMSTGSTSPPGRSCSPPGCWCTQKASNATHAHDMTHDHTLEPSETLPPYYDVLFLMNEAASDLPVESVLGWDESVDSLDSDWGVCNGDLCPALQDRFLRGAPGSIAGGTGGSETHDHGGWTGVENATGIYGGSYGMTVTSYGPSTTDMNHAHAYEHEHTLSVESHIPPYRRSMWVSPTTEGQIPLAGSIAMWSGVVDDIPMGWALCDGSEGTPDLSGLFLLGATSDEDLGEEGGDYDHDHLMDSDAGGTTGLSGGGNGNCSDGGGLMGFHTHSVPSHDHGMRTDRHEPPYYSLAYIMYEGTAAGF